MKIVISPIHSSSPQYGLTSTTINRTSM